MHGRILPNRPAGGGTKGRCASEAKRRSRASLVLAAPIVAALAMTIMASSPAAIGGAETPALKSISSRLDGAISTVLIEASEPVAYLTSQPDPLTVLVDLRNVNAAGLDGKPFADMLAPVSAVGVESASAPDGMPVARVRVRLDRAARHRVRSARNTILVEVDRSSASSLTATPAVPAIAPVPPRPAAVAPAEKRAAATALRSVRFARMDDGFAVTLAGNGPLLAAKVEEVKDEPPRVLLDFHGVATGSAPAVTNVKSEDVDKIRVATNSREPLITRVVIDLARRVPYTVEQIGEDLRVMFRRAAAAATAAVMPESAAPVTAPEKVEEPVAPATAAVVETPATSAAVMASTTTDAPAPPVAPAVVAPISQAPLPVPMPSVIAAAAQQTPTNILQQTANQPAGQRQFTGDPVTLDFQGADLRAVLRTFAEISNGLNIIIDPSIQGTVDVSLRDVPWDQALDIILRANKLGYSVEGNIVRIVPLNVLAQENEERRKLTEAQALAGELRTLTVPVSYAKAADLVPVITRSTLSARGDVQVDTRTNTLIIRDLAERIQSASDLIRTLDRPQPQVEIEARIVQLNRTSARELGISWGFGGNIDPRFGTSTGLAFPSSANLTGGTGGVNAANNSFVGLALGSINGALNLDVNLRALESNGKGRILATPRVATQNNVEAEITQGSQIPIQTVSNNTVTVTFKDAALTLRVTPQITAANTVIMRIFVEKASPNYSQTRTERPIPSIDTQRAVTTVLMGDGETTVIGGIYTRDESTTTTRTPLLNRVPLLGWLFKTERALDNSDELLIFITPRIAK
ncbi:MAG: type IV pilus secretin PilQ [Cyanobacteria bacterium]|nr:type IV pilus secretin PilQ [Cyanobacteriota bacterium]